MSRGVKCSSVWCKNIATETCPGCGGARYCSDHIWKHGHIRGSKLVDLVILIKHDDSIKDRQKIIEYYDEAHNQIEQEIRKLPNLQSITHTNNSNVISLSANWERENLRSMVNQILEIGKIDGLVIFPNYIEELKDAMEMHDFFKVVAYSSTLLESYGKQILIKHFGEKNQDRDHDRIYNLNLNATAIMLYSSGIIDKPLFDEINYVRSKRNILFIEHPILIVSLSYPRSELKNWKT